MGRLGRIEQVGLMGLMALMGWMGGWTDGTMIFMHRKWYLWPRNSTFWHIGRRGQPDHQIFQIRMGKIQPHASESKYLNVSE